MIEQDNPDYPDIDCDPPDGAEVGDVWFCPYCARKFQRIVMSWTDKLDQEHEAEAWYTSEVR